MMMSSPIPNPMASRESSSIRRKKKKAKTFRDQIQDSNISNQWKSEAHQQVYSSKLLQALRQVRLSSYPPPRRGKVMREAADRVLATTAKGRTRWSRAILKNRVTLKFMKNNRRQRTASAAMATSTLAVRNRRPRKPRLSILRLKSKKLPAVQRKVRILGKLVPGCRKETLPVILEETIDYISALQMQIKVMSGLDKLLSQSPTISFSS